MPELPEVEILVRHLAPLVKNRKILGVQVRRARVLGNLSPRSLARKLRGATFRDVRRRGKYLLFQLTSPPDSAPFLLVGHLGMTGRMYLSPAKSPLARHAAVVLNLGRQNFIFEDTRYFGRFTLDNSRLGKLGPEPLDSAVPPEEFKRGLARSTQSVKLRLLDQALVAGVGNIYASEALFHAKVSPLTPARRLDAAQVERIWHAIRQTLTGAIEKGGSIPLDFSGTGKRDEVFYYGQYPRASEQPSEQFAVYDREGLPCYHCGSLIERLVQGARSTYFCPRCQGSERRSPHQRNRK